MKTQFRAFRTSDWAEGLPSNRTVTLSTQQKRLIRNAENVLEWPRQSLGLNPIKYFWRNLPHPTWKSLRGEEVRRQMADTCQMLMSKACRIKHKILEAVKVLQLKGINLFFFLKWNEVVTILFLLCQYGVWSVDWCGGKRSFKAV